MKRKDHGAAPDDNKYSAPAAGSSPTAPPTFTSSVDGTSATSPAPPKSADAHAKKPPEADANTNGSAKQALADVAHTRTRSAWIGIIIGAVVLILLLVFILQNLNSQRISLFFWEVNLPQGVSLLIAAIAGALITAVVGGARMFQLHRAVRKVN